MSTIPKTSWVKAYIGLGSNVGDRVYFLQHAIFRLGRTEGFRIRKISSLYETDPLYKEGQPPFLNEVLEAEVILSPEALLKMLKRLERELGRSVREVWGPREIDLDLLSYGDLVVETSSLSVPHPRLHERDFVLIPLAEIAPTWTHPKFKKSVKTLLAEGRGVFHESHPKPYRVEVVGEAL